MKNIVPTQKINVAKRFNGDDYCKMFSNDYVVVQGHLNITSENIPLICP